jgi:pyruvate dehydrogenase E1 component alpha subunit
MIASQKAKHLLKQMMRIRRFEEACAEQYSAGRIRGFLHLYIGEEAVAVGTMEHLKPDDAIFAAYREHGHALARGISPRRIMAEMFGKVEGLCRGRGGSMHLFDRESRFFGGSAIVAGSLPLAVGMGLASKLQNKEQITACFFGEGAMAEGEFHESLNLAALWQLPVLFLCENNFYAMGTALSRSESQTDLVAKARSYQISASRVDGMDIMAVLQAAGEAIEHIRNTGQPYFLECQTYRFRAHSMFDPELYRDKAEVEKWKQRDPIDLFQKMLLATDTLSEADIEAIRSQAEQEVLDAIAFAEQSQLEDPKDLYRFVYCET